MPQTVKSYALDGVAARPVEVEVEIHPGPPGFEIVGLPGFAVRETRERVRAALISAGFEFPAQRILVNILPADLRRAAAKLDLALAVGIVLASGQKRDFTSGVAFIGELAPDGSLRHLNGALQIAEAARGDEVRALVLPESNGPEAALADGIAAVGLDSLARLPKLLAGRLAPRPKPPVAAEEDPLAPDLADLRGQPQLRRALELAAAGAHNLLIVGPPGAGKAMAAARLPSILPPLLPAEALEVARIASASGRFRADHFGVRPFRAPHHSISPVALIGGGLPPRPGEVTLAHGGVLILDELPEFSRVLLESLRAPLAHGEVSIFRGEQRQKLPARFQLIATANPCPCGRGDGDRDCGCAEAAMARYRARVSAALADCIDIRVDIRQPSAKEIGGPPGETSAEVRARVFEARSRQERRLGTGRCNAEMTRREARGCRRSPDALDLFGRGDPPLVDRACDRVLRIAQTAADLAGSEEIRTEDLAEALGLCRRERGDDLLGGSAA